MVEITKRYQIPAIGRGIRNASPELVKVLVPMREALNRFNGSGDKRAVELAELTELRNDVTALQESLEGQISAVGTAAQEAFEESTREADVEGAQILEPPIYGTVESLDSSGAVIGREDTDADTGASDSSTWVTVRTFQLGQTGTITVRTNAWVPLVDAPQTQAGQIRVLNNGAEVGAATGLTNTDTDEQVWNDVDVDSSGDVLEIQLKASVQNGGDQPANIDWSEVRALVRFVAWT